MVNNDVSLHVAPFRCAVAAAWDGALDGLGVLLLVPAGKGCEFDMKVK